jgi:hypothetical protein
MLIIEFKMFTVGFDLFDLYVPRTIRVTLVRDRLTIEPLG